MTNDILADDEPLFSVPCTPPTQPTPGEGSKPREGTSEPVAWAIVGPDGIVLDSHIYHTESLARRWAFQDGGQVLPLYRSPALTDAEREAVLFAARRFEISYAEERRVAATLRGLLERLK